MIRYFWKFLAIPGAFLLLGVIQLASAQDNSSAPAQAPSSNSTAPSPSSEKPKKVWTNDDMKSAGNLSVIGDSRNQKYTMTKHADPATIAKYKANLQKLQDQLNDVDKKLQAYKDFEFGKPSTDSGRDVSHGYSRTPVDQQMAKLQDKKKQLEQQIDDLFDAARKQGIESGELK